jgi:DNA adenine methylase
VSVKRNQAREDTLKVEQLDVVAERLRRVQIENQDFRKLLARIPDESETLIYADPPYMSEVRSRNGDGYRHELTADDHIDLLNHLSKFTNARVAVSGYSNKLYQERLAAWKRFDWPMRINVAQFGRDNRRATNRTESLWVNW